MGRTGILFGCFDLFHYGHVRIIREAQKHCDILCIGLFTDDVVRHYKFKSPAVTFQDRATLLMELFPECIIIPIDKREPMELDDNIILFVSNTMKDKKLFMVKETFKGKIIYIDYTTEISSSAIRRKIEAQFGASGYGC